MTDFDEFASRISGPVLIPADAGLRRGGRRASTSRWCTARMSWSAPTDAADVVEAVRFAREHGPARAGAGDRPRRAVPDPRRAAHHHEAPRRGAPSTHRRAPRPSAAACAGTRSSPRPRAHGLAPITGSSPTVGAVGYLLGGGLGPLNRSHGFSSDYLRSATVVTGAGELVEASAESNPDLFWALRGGKGGLGIVVEATIELVELSTLYGGSLFFEIEHAPAVLGGWLDWTTTAPRRHLDQPRHHPVPRPRRRAAAAARPPPAQPPLRVSRGRLREGADLAAPLRALAPVHLDALGELPAAEIARVHNDPTEPGLSWMRGLAVSGPRSRLRRLLPRGGRRAHLGCRSSSSSCATSAARPGRMSPRAARSAHATRSSPLAVIGVPDPALFETVLPARRRPTCAGCSRRGSRRACRSTGSRTRGSPSSSRRPGARRPGRVADPGAGGVRPRSRLPATGRRPGTEERAPRRGRRLPPPVLRDRHPRSVPLVADARPPR